MIEDLAHLAGADLVAKGLHDLRASIPSIEAALVAVGGPRLRRCGIDVPEWTENEAPETRLYQRIGQRHGLDAHRQYNALIGRLVSFERGLESQISRGTH